MWLFLGGFVTGIVLMSCIASKNYDELLTKYYELKHKLNKGNEDE